MKVKERCLIVFTESNQRRWIRVGYVVGGLLLFLFCFYLIDDELPLEITFALCLAIFWAFWRSFGIRNLLAIRVDDFFAANVSPVEWATIINVITEKRKLVIELKNGNFQVFNLGPFSHSERSLILYYVKAMWEAEKVSGKLTIPNVEDVELNSNRLEIRALNKHDEEGYVALKTDPNEAKLQLFDAQSDIFESDCYKDTLLHHKTSVLYWHLGIFLSESHTFVGYLALSMDQTFLQRSATLGIGIKEEHQNLGYGTEAIAELLKYLETETTLQKVTAGCFAVNQACATALRNAGMRQAGMMEKDWCRFGKWVDKLEFEKVYQRDKERS